jgi:putative peptidoglycan lipid II flippase
MSEAAPAAPSTAPIHRSLLRSAGLMTVMTLISRVLGLVREQVRALYLGTGLASDAFGLAATIPNLFRRLFAEGVMTAAFVPVFAEHQRTATPASTRQFLSRFFTLLTCAVTAFTVLAILATPWLIDTFFSGAFGDVPGKVALTAALTQLMWPYLVLVTVAALLQGVLNTHRVFGPSAFAPVLMNLAIVLATVLLHDRFADPSYALVVGFLAGGVLQLAFQIPFLLRLTPFRFGIDFNIFDPQVRRVLRLMAPGLLSAGIYQLNVFISQLIAASLDAGAIASLQYSLRLQELVLGVFVVSVTQVILPELSHHTARGDTASVQGTFSYALRLIAFVTLPCTALLILVAPELVGTLFEFGAFDAESTRKTSEALVFHAIGLFFIGQGRVATQVFFACKDMATPTRVSLLDAALNVALCLALAGPLGHAGIALAASLSALAHGAVLQALLRRRHGVGLPRGDGTRLLKVGLATALMAGAVLGLDALWSTAAASRTERFLWLAAAGLVAVTVFLGAASRLGVNELAGLLARRRRRTG